MSCVRGANRLHESSQTLLAQHFALRVRKLALDLGVRNVLAVANRVDDDGEMDRIAREELNLRAMPRPTTPLLAIIVAMGAMFWASPRELLLWLGTVFVSKGILISLCWQFIKAPREDATTPAWHAKITAAEFLYGVTWAVMTTTALNDPNYDPLVDFNFDGAIDVIDLLTMADFWGPAMVRSSASQPSPLTAETRHLIDEKALRRMKPTAFLINTARGGIVDERALVTGVRALSTLAVDYLAGK